MKFLQLHLTNKRRDGDKGLTNKLSWSQFGRNLPGYNAHWTTNWLGTCAIDNEVNSPKGRTMEALNALNDCLLCAWACETDTRQLNNAKAYMYVCMYVCVYGVDQFIIDWLYVNSDLDMQISPRPHSSPWQWMDWNWKRIVLNGDYNYKSMEALNKYCSLSSIRFSIW